MNQEQEEMLKSRVWRCLKCGTESGHDHTFCMKCFKQRWSQFGLDYNAARALVRELYSVDDEQAA